MKFEEYRRQDAISLAGLITKREVSAMEVLETAIARAEQINPTINSIVHKQYEQARKAVAAGLPEGPLKGVPYLIKDLGFFETGEPATFGSSLFKGFVADHETAYVTLMAGWQEMTPGGGTELRGVLAGITVDGPRPFDRKGEDAAQAVTGALIHSV
jgi:Asp-tRNA(Asn)/Glu-tRNA(Gln) amidotransferase A subunit family amidase